MPRETKNLKGMRFGRLYVLEYEGTKENSAGNKISYWKCKCDCGNKTSVSATHLLRGNTKSCGCLKTEGAKKVIDVSGQKFGKLTVLEMIKITKKKRLLVGAYAIAEMK